LTIYAGRTVRSACRDSLDRVEIREATADEHAEAGRVTAAAYEGLVRDASYLERIADVADRAARTEVLIAVEDGSIVGSLTLELSRRVNPHDDPLETHRAHIRMLGVSPNHQSRGIGRLLMDEAERRALAAGKTEITLHTTEAMRTARAMYAGLGYERMPDDVLPDGFVLMGYRKVLGADSD
jgi:ribosomal protein S18 acetylase RimI-like enzyme